jgi:hypothetical protein
MSKYILNLINTIEPVSTKENFKSILSLVEKDFFTILENNLKEGIHSFFYSHHNIRSIVREHSLLFSQEKYMIIFLEELLKNTVIQELLTIHFDIFSKTVFLTVKAQH